MRESRTLGSVRGAFSNGRPYRDRAPVLLGTPRRATYGVARDGPPRFTKPSCLGGTVSKNAFANMNNHLVDIWVVAKALNDTDRLDELLSEDAIFVSPLHDVPQIGKQAAKLNIAGIMKLMAEAEHKYVRQIVGPLDAMLEFESTMDGLKLNGVELLRWNDDCKITEVRVLLRPLDIASKARDRMERLLLSKKRTK